MSNRLLILSFAIAPILALIKLVRSFAQGMGLVALAQAPHELIRPILIVGAIGTLFVLGASASAYDYLIVSAAAGIIALGIGTLLLWRRLPQSSGAPLIAKPQPHELAPFFGISLVSVFHTEFATLALTLLSTAEQTGLYQPTSRFALLLALPAGAVAARFAPRIAEFYTNGELDRLKSVTHQFTLVTTALTALLAIILGLAGPWLMLLFGPAFVEAAPLLWVVGAAYLFSIACGPVGFLLTMTGDSKKFLGIRIKAMLVAVALAVLLVPTYGIWGAVIAISASMVVSNILGSIAVKKRHGFQPSILAVAKERMFGVTGSPK